MHEPVCTGCCGRPDRVRWRSRAVDGTRTRCSLLALDGPDPGARVSGSVVHSGYAIDRVDSGEAAASGERAASRTTAGARRGRGDELVSAGRPPRASVEPAVRACSSPA